MRKTQKEVVEKIPIFGDRLKILMLVKDINNQELANKIGVSKGVIANAITGRVPQLHTIISLAEYFGVTVDFLLGRSGAIKIEIQTQNIIIDIESEVQAE